MVPRGGPLRFNKFNHLEANVAMSKLRVCRALPYRLPHLSTTTLVRRERDGND